MKFSDHSVYEERYLSKNVMGNLPLKIVLKWALSSFIIVTVCSTSIHIYMFTCIGTIN